jgi:hypothetical protein
MKTKPILGPMALALLALSPLINQPLTTLRGKLNPTCFMRTCLKKLFLVSALISITLTLGSSAYAQMNWDLASDWNPPANPNGAWTYGDYDNNTFVNLTYVGGGYFPAGGAATNGFIYKNLTGIAQYGIAAGQVSLQSDQGTPVARWTAPTSGYYDILVLIGGTTGTEDPGQGNYFAQYAGLNINMVGQTAANFTENVKSWAFTNVLLSAGATVDAYVAYQGYADAGANQTIFQVKAVPTPGAPALTITITTTNTAMVSWPSPSVGWTLQQTTNLSTVTWVTSPESINNNGTLNYVIVNPPTGNLFFRLANP